MSTIWIGRYAYIKLIYYRKLDFFQQICLLKKELFIKEENFSEQIDKLVVKHNTEMSHAQHMLELKVSGNIEKFFIF